jgi:hypothetical protein
MLAIIIAGAKEDGKVNGLISHLVEGGVHSQTIEIILIMSISIGGLTFFVFSFWYIIDE